MSPAVIIFGAACRDGWHDKLLSRLSTVREASNALWRSDVDKSFCIQVCKMIFVAIVFVFRVCTDVASSTRLWEWNPSVMDSAIDMHNSAIRDLLEEYGGHEIRNVRQKKGHVALNWAISVLTQRTHVLCVVVL